MNTKQLHQSITLKSQIIGVCNTFGLTDYPIALPLELVIKILREVAAELEQNEEN